MKLTLLGTGCPAVSTRRYGPANLVQHKDQSFLVDCGTGCSQRLLQANCSGAQLDALFITHMHSDHIIDLYQLIQSSWHQNRKSAPLIYGPKGLEAHVKGLMELWLEERELRILHEKRLSTAALAPELFEIEAKIPLKFKDLRIHGFSVNHKPIEHAFGYVFQSSNKKLVLSGDTRPCQEILRSSEGADVLVHEVFIHGGLKESGTRSQAGIQSVESYHTLSTEVGDIAAQAKVGCLVLNHFVPPQFDQMALLREVRKSFSGPIILGEDLLSIDVENRFVQYKELAFSY
jgi:ribonuclease Z